jgi:hypothetical protein
MAGLVRMAIDKLQGLCRCRQQARTSPFQIKILMPAQAFIEAQAKLLLLLALTKLLLLALMKLLLLLAPMKLLLLALMKLLLLWP